MFSKFAEAGRAARVAVVLAGALAASLSSAQERPPLVTDRPDQTESADTVPPGAVQVEAGWLHVEGAGGARGTAVDELPGTLVRVGLAADWELRLGWGGWLDGPDADGAADTGVGAKWRIGRSAAGGTTVALLASTSVPTGNPEVTSDRFDPELRLSVAHELTERFGLGWNLGVARESFRDPGDRVRSSSFWFATAVLAASAGERAGVFLELFGEGGGSRGGAPATSLDGGVTYLLRPNVQLDLAAGVGLSSAADDRFLGFGVSFRLPG